MSAFAKWLLPTDDPRVLRHRAEVLAFTGETEGRVARQPAASPPRPRPQPQLPPPEPPSLRVAAPTSSGRPPVDAARVRSLLESRPSPEAGLLRADPAGTRRRLWQLSADLDRLARRLAGRARGG